MKKEEIKAAGGYVYAVKNKVSLNLFAERAAALEFLQFATPANGLIIQSIFVNGLADVGKLKTEIERLTAMMPREAKTCRFYASFVCGRIAEGLSGYGNRCPWDGGTCPTGKWELKEG